MAPVTRSQKKALSAAPPPPADRLSNLPAEIQAHILTFLPAEEAVRTCVLSRAWRKGEVWKQTRRLLITATSVQEVRQFVDRLLHVRLDKIKEATLHACEIRFDPSEEIEDGEEYSLDGEDMHSIHGWICRALKCQIKMLQVSIDPCGYDDGYLYMGDVPLLVSRYLTRLEHTGVEFGRCVINLDGCPALEHLEIHGCYLLGVRKIMSLSLKHLVITDCDSKYDEKRIHICVPRLVSLLLDNTNSLADEGVRTPLLHRMPELVGAKVHIDSLSYLDDCACDDPVACYHVTRDGDTSDTDSDSGDYAGQNTTKCVILEGLAQARDLVLIDDGRTYILRRDLRWCPTFSKLKTLLLSQVYSREPADCNVLECMLEHAPLLEKLTLIFEKKWAHEGKYKVKIKGYPNAKVKSTKISQHLQIVEIKCEHVNGLFDNVLDFLGTLNICFEIRVTKKMMKK